MAVKPKPDNMISVKIKKAQIFRGKTVHAKIPRLDAIIRYIAGKGKLGDHAIEIEAVFVRIGPLEYRQLDATEASKLYVWLKAHPSIKHQDMNLTQVEEALR